MNERLAELESQVKQIYEKLGMSEESEEPEFKVGDWVFTKHDTFYVVRITEIYDDDLFDYRFDNHFGTSSENGFTIGALIRKATPAEIETALRKEWARRAKEKGWDNPDEAEIEAHAGNNERYVLDVNSGAYTSLYNQRDDRLYNKNGIIYHDGNWATPKEKKSDKFFEWDVETVKGTHWRGFDYTSDKFIKINGEVFEKPYLRKALHDLKRLMDEGLGYKDIHDLVTQLEELDL